MKSVVKLDIYYYPWHLQQAIANYVEYYNYQRYHESLDNLTPADVYFGRAEEILNQRQDHSQARALLEEIQERYRRADRFYTEASTLLDAGRMGDSVNHINEAMEAYPDHPSAGSVLTKAEMNSERFAECMATATTAMQNGAWDTAASLLDEAMRLDRQVPNVVEAINSINRIRQAITDMHAALSSSDFPRAGQLAGLADSLADDLLTSLPGLSV